MIDYFESFVFSIEIAEICIFQVMNSIVCNANKENCSHITQTMQFYTQTVFRQFSMSKIILRKFLVIWGKQQKKKTFYIASNFRHPSVLAVARMVSQAFLEFSALFLIHICELFSKIQSPVKCQHVSEAYLNSNRTSTIELFCKTSERLKAVHYFWKKN